MTTPTRWAVLGTANIAARQFLPALRRAGHVAVAVGSRDPGRAATWAKENRTGRAVSYDAAIEADDVDAVYVALPNDQHVRWAARAAATGRAVLCEKPLGLDAAEVDGLVDRVGDALLWEAFVFPFHPQTALLTELCRPGGPIGGLREIISEFHFRVTKPENIRWNAGLGGGALMDVGCYPIRLARLLYGGEPDRFVAAEVVSESGVDAEFTSIATFPDDRRLIFSVGMRRAPSTYTRLIGTDGELRVSNPFHPTEHDTVELWLGGERSEAWTADPARAFQHGIEHVAAVVAGTAAPRHLAATDAPGNARALDLARAAAR
ncbi:MAG TPA: Gfo/Idh/MocA family oxidoreductase [Pseudonocardiaceae bacterium]|jgi:predicted dehydrogenase